MALANDITLIQGETNFYPKCWSAVFATLSSEGPVIGSVNFTEIDDTSPNEDIANAFAKSINESRRSVEMFWLCDVSFKDSWQSVLRAILKRTDVVRIALANCDLDDACMSELANLMERSSHLESVRLQDNPGLTKVNVQRLVNASIRSHPNLKRLQFIAGNEFPIGPEVLKTFVRLKLANPGVILGSGYFGRFLGSLIAMNSINNETAHAEVSKYQADILRSFADGRWDVAKVQFQELQDSVAKPEQDRILTLLPELLDKYAMIGGFALMATLPCDFDEYKGACPLTQFVAPGHLDQTKDVRVRTLLAIAAYKRKDLVTICSYVESAINALAGTMETYLVPAVVSAFLEEHQLNAICAELSAFSLTFEGWAKEYSGDYVQVGFYKGKPCFERKVKDGICGRSYLFARVIVWGTEWVISNFGMGSDKGMFRMKVNRDLEDGGEWILGPEDGTVRCSLKPIKHTISLREFLVHFLHRRVCDANIKNLMSLGNDLARLCIGPHKSFMRAMDKGSPEQLKDLNRCTFEFDSVAIMVLAFHLLRSRVEKLGGRVTRFSNFFVKDNNFTKTGGLLHSEYDKPPVIHIFIQVSGWTFEVMLALVDVINVKGTLHKFYDIVRAQSVEEALMPVFDSQHSFSTEGPVGSGINAVRSSR